MKKLIFICLCLVCLYGCGYSTRPPESVITLPSGAYVIVIPDFKKIVISEGKKLEERHAVYYSAVHAKTIGCKGFVPYSVKYPAPRGKKVRAFKCSNSPYAVNVADTLAGGI